MCSKRVEEQEPLEEEDQEQQQQQDQEFQNTPTFQQNNQSIVNYQIQLLDQNMGGTNDYSYPQQQPPWILPQVFHHHHSAGYTTQDLAFPAGDHSAYLFPPPPPTTSSYGGLLNRRVPGGGLQFAYEGRTSSSDHNLRLISETLGQMVQPGGAGCMPFGLQAEMGKMTAQEIMDAKALAASKSHSEAERRRRERINNHLAKLRSLLPSTTKTDKASLLAEVIQHVKELKRQTSIIAEQSPVPTETDELTIDTAASDEQGNLVIRASLCCDDRSDLLPDIISTLKSLRLRTLKAEITTLGGRMKNVLFITADHQPQPAASTCTDHQYSTINNNSNSLNNMIQEAFKAVMEKANGDHNNESSASVKRQRTNNINNNVLLDHHHRRT